jgi:hypothetical protein
MAEAMLDARPIQTDADERPLKIAYLIHAPSRPQILVLGSSRAMEISSAWFPHQTLFNGGVRYGGIDDAVSFFELSLETGKTPDLVLLELSPTLIPVDVRHKDWRSAAPYFDRALTRYHVTKPASRLIHELMSPFQFRQNLRTLLGVQWGIPARNDTSQIRPDGFLHYPDAEDQRASSELDADVARGLTTPDPTTQWGRTQSHPHEFEIALLRRFLDDMRAQHIRLIVFLAPVHPIAYAYYASRGGFDEHWIRKEMASRGIPVVGSYSPTIVKATSSDFYDQVHPRPGLVRRLLWEAGLMEQ